MAGKIIEYGLYGDPPKILGIDLAGVIEEVGPDVKGYKKGDRMYPPDPSLVPFSFAIPQALQIPFHIEHKLMTAYLPQLASISITGDTNNMPLWEHHPISPPNSPIISPMTKQPLSLPQLIPLK